MKSLLRLGTCGVWLLLGPVMGSEREPVRTQAKVVDGAPSRTMLDATAAGKASALATLSTKLPQAQWDVASARAGDIDGDGKKDWIVLGYLKGEIALGVVVTSDGVGENPQILRLPVSRNVQMAICSTPAKLVVLPLNCTADDNSTFPGCQLSSGAVSVQVDDGECDPVNVYWAHDRKHIVSWRN